MIVVINNKATLQFGVIVNYHLNRSDRFVVLRIVAIYAFFSCLWIYLSDSFLGILVRDPAILTRYSVFKGFFFIAVTVALLYQLIARYIERSKRAEEELRESRKLLNAVIEGTSDAVYVKDLNGRYLHFNSAAARITGKSPKDVLGKDDSFLFSPDEAKTIMERDRSVIAAGSTMTCEESVTDATGKQIIFLSTKGPLFDEQGNVTSLFGITRDITERIRAKEALQKAYDELELRVAQRTEELEKNRAELEMQNEKLLETYHELEVETTGRITTMEELREKDKMLIQQSRMAAMGEMLGNIAHQWRQPLNLLGLKVQQLGLLREEGELSGEVLDENIHKVMEIVQNLSYTIDDFRSFSLPDEEKRLFSVNQVIAKTVSLIEESFKEQQIIIDINNDVDEQLRGFPNEYAQVLLNILMNARDAFQEQGTKEARVTIRSFMENGKAVVTICDNAGGIKEEIMGKIFDAYFTTKNLGKGTGVGLFMSKTIIEKNMGGRLTVHNTGDGAEFRIEI
jgi:PAS domain S-box-containing protein